MLPILASDHVTVGVPVPPVGVNIILPVEPPLHKTLVTLGVRVILQPNGLIVNVPVVVQPLLSRTVYV